MPTQRLNLFYGGQPGMSASGFDVMSENARGIMRAAQDKARFLADEEDLQYRRGVAEAERARHMQLEDEDRATADMLRRRKLSLEDEDRATADMLRKRKLSLEDEDRAELPFREATAFVGQPAAGLDLPGGGGELPEGVIGRSGRAGGALSLGGPRGSTSEAKNAARMQTREKIRQRLIAGLNPDAPSLKPEEAEGLRKAMSDIDAEVEAEHASKAAPLPAPAPVRVYDEAQKAQAGVLLERLMNQPPEQQAKHGRLIMQLQGIMASGQAPSRFEPAPSQASPDVQPAPPAQAPNRAPAPPPPRDLSLHDMPDLDAAPSPLAWRDNAIQGIVHRDTPATRIESVDPVHQSTGGFAAVGKFISDSRAQAIGIGKAISQIPHDEHTAVAVDGIVKRIDSAAQRAGGAITSNDRAGYLAIQKAISDDLARLRAIYQSKQMATPAGAGSPLGL